MRLSDSTCLALFAGLSIVACGTAVSPPSGSNDVGGTLNPGSGGNTSASSSSSAQGGTEKSTTTTRQDDPQGGDVSTGGVTQAAGGKVSTGGRSSTSTQGVGGVVTGGRTSTGGTVSGNGGTTSVSNTQTGGTPIGNGGSATSAPSGGKAATGGAAAATGGAVATCVDTPRSSESCADAKSWGFCSQSWFTNCQVTCGTCGSNSGAGGAQGQGGTNNNGTKATGGSSPTATGGAQSSSTLPPVTGGQNAWASRYWDCCKPACGWTGNTNDPISSCDKSNNNIGVSDGAKNACENGGSAFMCWSGVPHSLNDSVSYGFAAASGNNYKCGQCYQIQFDGGSHNGGANPGAAAIKGKQMIIQVINNGGVESNQFDILIPGGGVGALNACSNQWGSSDLGAQYGGFLTGCNGDTGCVQNKCNTVFAGKTDLLAGCTWFLNWYKAADNPTFQYKAVNCPSDFNSVMGGLNK